MICCLTDRPVDSWTGRQTDELTEIMYIKTNMQPGLGDVGDELQCLQTVNQNLLSCDRLMNTLTKDGQRKRQTD